jgi:hypothetical protein
MLKAAMLRSLCAALRRGQCLLCLACFRKKIPVRTASGTSDSPPRSGGDFCHLLSIDYQLLMTAFLPKKIPGVSARKTLSKPANSATFLAYFSA